MGFFDMNSVGQGASMGSGFGPWGAVAGGVLGGLLGGGNKMMKEQQKLFKFQYGIADQLRRFGQSIPLSDPQEQAALATQKAFLGGQQRADTNQMYSQMARAPGGGFQHQGDAMNTMMGQQTGQRMALDSTHLLAALGARREGMLQASQAAGGALNAANSGRYDTTGDFPQLFGQLAQSYSYQRALKKYQQQNRPVGSGPGETPVSYDAQSPVQGPAPPAGMVEGQRWFPPMVASEGGGHYPQPGSGGGPVPMDWLKAQTSWMR